MGWRRNYIGSYIGLTEIAKLIWDIHMFFLSQDDRACVLVGLVISKKETTVSILLRIQRYITWVWLSNRRETQTYSLCFFFVFQKRWWNRLLWLHIYFNQKRETWQNLHTNSFSWFLKTSTTRGYSSCSNDYKYGLQTIGFYFHRRWTRWNFQKLAGSCCVSK